MAIVRVFDEDGTTLLGEFETDDLVPPFTVKVVKVDNESEFMRVRKSLLTQVPDRAGNVQPLELDDDD
jgi:hypothetical protein